MVTLLHGEPRASQEPNDGCRREDLRQLGGVMFGLRKARQPSLDARLIQRGAPRQPEAGTAAADGPATLRASASPFGKFVVTLIFALFWNGIVSVFVAEAVQGFARDRPDWFLTLFLIPFVLVGAGLVLAAGWAMLALFNPRVVLTVSTARAPLGKTIEVAWDLAGRARSVRRLRLTLEGREEATYQRGTNTVTDTSVFATIEIAQAADAFAIATGRAAVTVPADSMHTFEATHNKVLWRLKVHGEIRLWPDIDNEYAIVVLPAGAKGWT
jgi:hypothetical protein